MDLETEMVLPDTEENIKKISDFYYTLPPLLDHDHQTLSDWGHVVRIKMKDHLFQELDYKPIYGPQNELYYNIFLLMAFPMKYVDINKKVKIRMDDLKCGAENTKCFCSHPITNVCLIPGGKFPLFLGNECILKGKFISPQQMCTFSKVAKQKYEKKKNIQKKKEELEDINQQIKNEPNLKKCVELRSIKDGIEKELKTAKDKIIRCTDCIVLLKHLCSSKDCLDQLVPIMCQHCGTTSIEPSSYASCFICNKMHNYIFK